MRPVRAIIPTPLGALRLEAREGLLTECRWVDSPAEEASIYNNEENGCDDAAVIAEATRQLGEYFAGVRSSFDLPLKMEGSEFGMMVWGELTHIPFGSTTSYAEIARRVGRPRGFRAVAQACSRNPLAVVVPCHRVVASGGGIGGYTAPRGVATKLALLNLERKAL